MKYISDIRLILFIVSQIFIIWENRFSKWVIPAIGVIVAALFIIEAKNLAAKKISAAEFWLNTLYSAGMILICLVYCLA